MRLAYLSLGSNLGSRWDNLTLAVPLVARGDDYRLSKVYETEPIGGVEQDNFWNMVIEINTDASASELLERARVAEESAGRTRDVRWGPRTLDVDVLLVGDETSDDPDIVVPHPRLYERAFVLVPLRELTPDLVSDEQLAAGVGNVVELGTLDSLR
ncbi:MAG TPA: 2-amino-4-hydroxy-6-hydroxymethyldihydropteridine diphosphokinase [Acidimicrobiales bacterium]